MRVDFFRVGAIGVGLAYVIAMCGCQTSALQQRPIAQGVQIADLPPHWRGAPTQVLRRDHSDAFRRAMATCFQGDRFGIASGKCSKTLEWFGGAGIGLSMPGRQDLKLKKHSELGVLTNYLFANRVEASTDPLGTFYGGAWGKHFGFEGSISYWRTTVRPRHFINRGPSGGSFELPDRKSLLQQRVSVFTNALWRFPVPGDDLLNPDRFLYAGLGGGLVYTKVERGHTGWALGFQLMVGGVLRLDEESRLRVEFRYMAAPDADSNRRAQWRADTSGTRIFPGFAHNDTRFYVLVLAFEHVF